VIGAAAVCSVVGDNLGYWVGHRYAYALLVRHGRYIGPSVGSRKSGAVPVPQPRRKGGFFRSLHRVAAHPCPVPGRREPDALANSKPPGRLFAADPNSRRARLGCIDGTLYFSADEDGADGEPSALGGTDRTNARHTPSPTGLGRADTNPLDTNRPTICPPKMTL
jgi:hypothetical protein